MKNILLFTLATFISFSSFGQNIIDRHYSDLQDRENITSVFVSGKMFSYASYIEVEDDEELDKIKDFVTKIQSFNLIVAHDLENPIGEFKKGLKVLNRDYEELIQVRDKEGRFSVYVDETNGVVHELVGIATDNEKFVVGTLMGEMDLDKISEMIGKINTEGNDNPVFERFKDTGISEWKAYPNPVNTSGTLNLELPDNMIGGKATLFDNNGAQVKNQIINTNFETVDLEGLSPGQYIIQLDNETTTMKKKIVIIK